MRGLRGRVQSRRQEAFKRRGKERRRQKTKKVKTEKRE